MAALEAALALRELRGERIATTLIAPNPEFVARALPWTTGRQYLGAVEFERKSLAGALPGEVTEREERDQGYSTSDSDGPEVRIRRRGDRCTQVCTT